jgi:hypothetical protein
MEGVRDGDVVMRRQSEVYDTPFASVRAKKR